MPAWTATSTDPDPVAILTSLGHVVYDWRIDTDTLRWGMNVGRVLRLADATCIASGAGFAAFCDRTVGRGRLDAILAATQADTGDGVAFEASYPFLVPGAATDARLWIEDNGRWFAGADGRPVRAHGVIRVVNDRRERDELLAAAAAIDDLTGQFTRARLKETLERMIEDARRVRRSAAFLVAGIEGLGGINEAYGFSVADEVIAAIGRRIRSRMRGVDALGRFSGNKFGVAIASCDTEEMPIAAARFIEAVAEDPVQTRVGPVHARISIGGVLAPRHAADAAEAMSRAQEAFDLCRATRRGGFVAFTPSVARDDARRANATIIDEIVAALNERRIVLAFQPVVDAKTGAIDHHECLVRMRRPDGTVVSAGSIVPLSEKLGLVRLVDHRVLELAVEAMEREPTLRLAINLSAATYSDQDWLAALAMRVHRRRDIAERLTVEITESAAIGDLSGMAEFVRLMKDYGVRVAIDDFGAGYSSFRALRDLAIDEVKIDGAFVQNMAHSPDDRFFVRTLIGLARQIGLKTVAEWVQDETSARLLTEWGCDCLQGSLYGMASIEPPAVADPARHKAG